MTHTSVAPDTEQTQKLDQEPSIRQMEIQMDNQGWHGKKNVDVLYVNLRWEDSGRTYIFSGCHRTPFKLIVCCYFKLNSSILELFFQTHRTISMFYPITCLKYLARFDVEYIQLGTKNMRVMWDFNNTFLR